MFHLLHTLRLQDIIEIFAVKLSKPKGMGNLLTNLEYAIYNTNPDG